MENKKFSTIEIILGCCFTLFTDTICLLIDLTGVGLVISPIIQGSTTLATSWWLKSKGNQHAFKLNRQLAKQIANFLPVLPTNTTVFAVEIWLHNNLKTTPALNPGLLK